MLLRNQELCDYHRQQTDIASIFSTGKSGHGHRWAKEFLQAHSEKHENCIKQLETHLEDAKLAKEIVNANIKKLKQSDFHRYMLRLNGHGDLMTTKLKFDIWDKALEHYMDSLQMDEFLVAVLPWGPSEQGADHIHIAYVSPLRPTLAAIERALMFSETELLAAWLSLSGEARAAWQSFRLSLRRLQCF